MSLAYRNWRHVFGLARRCSTIGFHLLWHTVELAMSTRLCLLLWLLWFLYFRFDALTELGAFMRTEFLCISVLRIASGPWVKLVSSKSALTAPLPPPPPPLSPPLPPPPVVYSTDRSKAVVPVLVLLFCCFVVYSTRRLVLCLTLCYFVLVFFSSFSIEITSLGEERANLSAFRTFVRFSYVCSICACLVLSVSSSSWCLGRGAVCDCGTPWTFSNPFCKATIYFLFATCNS